MILGKEYNIKFSFWIAIEISVDLRTTTIKAESEKSKKKLINQVKQKAEEKNINNNTRNTGTEKKLFINGGNAQG